MSEQTTQTVYFLMPKESVEEILRIVHEVSQRSVVPDMSGYPTAEELKDIAGMFREIKGSDGGIVAFDKDGLVFVAEKDEEVLSKVADTAVSLAIEILNSGKLPSGSDPKLVEEALKLIGEERAKELTASSASTLELQPQLSNEEKLAQALAYYDKRKAQREEMMQEMQKRIGSMAQSDKMDVEDVEASDVSGDVNVEPKIKTDHDQETMPTA